MDGFEEAWGMVEKKSNADFAGKVGWKQVDKQQFPTLFWEWVHVDA